MKFHQLKTRFINKLVAFDGYLYFQISCAYPSGPRVAPGSQQLKNPQAWHPQAQGGYPRMKDDVEPDGRTTHTLCTPM